MTSERVKAANQWAVRMDAAAFGIEEDAGPIFFPIQSGSAVVSVTFNEFCGRQVSVQGKARDFIGVDLNFLVAATQKTSRT
jgi:hypothetical protein